MWRLLCATSMVASHQDFRKSSEPGALLMPHPAGSKPTALLRQHISTTWVASLSLCWQPLQLVRGVEVAANGLRMTQGSSKSISLGFPALLALFSVLCSAHPARHGGRHFGKILLIASSNPGRSSVRKIRTFGPPRRFLRTSSQFRALSPSAPKSQNPRVSLCPLGLIPEAMYTRSLGVFPRRIERKVLSQTPGSTPRLGAFPARLSLVLQ